jgi:hypothetical protein
MKPSFLAFIVIVLFCLKTRVLATNDNAHPRGLTCTICLVVVRVTEEFLSKNATEEEIVHFVEKELCSLVPKIFRPEVHCETCFLMSSSFSLDFDQEV